jgi:hypothetical protein
MIEARMQKARRLLEVQKGLQRLEEAKIAGLRSRQAEVAVLQEELIGALNKDDGLQGLFVVAIVRRLKSLGEEATRLAEELERRSAVLRTHAGRAKWAERRSRVYEQELARARAQKELLELLERIIPPKDASLP